MDRGYLGNYYLKKIGEQIEFTPEMLKEYMKCAQDPVYFAENYIKIVHVDKGLVSKGSTMSVAIEKAKKLLDDEKSTFST